MQNIDMKVEGNILTIRVDLSKHNGISKSGKSINIATTQGNVSVPDQPHVKVGLNVYQARDASKTLLAGLEP
jgi:hypothetical protein